jgi:sulfite reductase beta subunit-like hemoprotein
MSEELQQRRPGVPRRERPLTQEEVLKRNSVERMKLEKHPFDVIHDIPRFIEMPYEDIPEEDILRMQWYGLYHDKPKVGEFMIRVKIANGTLTADQLQTIGEFSIQHGQNSGELTTRQCIQIHHVRLKSMPHMFEVFKAAGLANAGACGDNLRNITGCPVAGIEPEELFDVRPVIAACVTAFSGNREYGNLPRKHKHTISACPYHCNAPEIHDIALVGTRQGGKDGFAIWVGGGLSAVPRIGKALGCFIEPHEAVEVLGGLMDVWRTDLRYRMSRAKARFKFMIMDDGPERTLERLQEQLGRSLTPLEENPRPVGRTEHMGIRPQKQEGLFYIGFPVFPGLMSGEQMIEVAAVMREFGKEFRITREQNFILTDIPEAMIDTVVGRIRDIGFDVNVNPIRGASIGCTGEPHCNFSVGETKPMVVEIVNRLEERFGEQVRGLHMYVDGCPHACGQHWVGDIGLQGTTRTTDTGKVQAYDIILRGALGPAAEIGTPILRRVPSSEAAPMVERLVGAWLEGRGDGETIQQFFGRHEDAQIGAIADWEVRERRERVAAEV